MFIIKTKQQLIVSLNTFFENLEKRQKIEEKEIKLVDKMAESYFDSDECKALDIEWDMYDKTVQWYANAIMVFLIETATKSKLNIDSLKWVNESQERRIKYITKSKGAIVLLAATLK